MIDLHVFDGIVNTTLLNEIIAFILDTAGADYARRKELETRCIFYDKDVNGDALQEKYGFLYLGELLERYEERFGMPEPDLRAIALALGYTRDLLTDGMFVGSQRADFRRKVQRKSNGDIYLTGALFLDSADDPLRYAPMDWPFARTEELVFAISLQPDFTQAVQHLKTQLAPLLGKGRTMPIMGNTSLLDWLTAQATPVMKTLKGRDFTLLRVLCALSSSHVKPSSKHHGLLLEHGWPALEIAWANAVLALKQGALNPQGIVAEKIVVELFRRVLTHNDPLSEEEYASLSSLFRQYQRFPIKCYGCEKLEDTLVGSVIREPATCAWFGKLVDIGHPAFSGFDILAPKWDSLAATLPKYRELFESSLNIDMTMEDIKARIGRYDGLTGGGYLAACMEERYSSHFGLMVNKEIIDLWQCFRDSLDGDGNVIRPDTLGNIRRYLDGLHTTQAYRFYEKFFAEYGMEGLQRFFGWDCRNFKESLVKRQYSYSNAEALCLQRDFLDDDGHRQLLDWLQAYYYIYEPDKYAQLVVLILRDEFAVGLLSHEEQLALFNFAVAHKELVRSCEQELKHRYMTEAQLKAEQEARAAAEREAESRRKAAEVQAIRDEVEEAGTSFQAIFRILDSYRFYRSKYPAACQIVYNKLPGVLEGCGYQLKETDLAYFLRICIRLLKTGNMSLTGLQEYISRLKECEKHDDSIRKAG